MQRAALQGWQVPYVGAHPIANGTLIGFSTRVDGTLFKITETGAFSIVCQLGNSSCDGGSIPSGPLLQATSGYSYGLTAYGGASHHAGTGGTLYEVTPGAVTRVYSFCSEANCADGSSPIGSLAQDASGSIYGTTSAGGTNNTGTVFKYILGVGLTTIDADNGGDGLILATDGHLYGVTPNGGEWPRDGI